MSQKLIFAIISYLFSHSIHSFFVSIKNPISISRLKFGLKILISQNQEDLSNIFIYQKNKLFLNKILKIKSQGLVKQILRKLSSILSIIEAELNLLDPYKKKSVFQPKIFSHLLFIRELSKHNHTQLFCIYTEYLTLIIFCESVLGVNHMPYTEDFAHFGQKQQFKIKIRLKQRNAT